MAKRTGNSNSTLNSAKAAKNDEFYTQLPDIEKELKHYHKHFKGKVVYCNCDDPRVSNFFHYFSYNFEKLGLKKLITTCYKNQDANLFSRHQSEKGCWLEYTGDKNGNKVPDPEEIGLHPFEGDGDFRSPECIELLKQADVVVTNPPFSLFREYVALLDQYRKKFVILGNKNAITYKETFKLIKENKMWVGMTPMGADILFDLPVDFANELRMNKQEGSAYKIVNGIVKGRSQAVWFTHLDIAKRHEELTLYKQYIPKEYPRYDNYDAIEVSKTTEIPMDYGGVMGVPISFLDKYNPDQFEIIGSADDKDYGSLSRSMGEKVSDLIGNGLKCCLQ